MSRQIKIVVLDPQNADPAWGTLDDAAVFAINQADLQRLMDDDATIPELMAEYMVKP